MISDVTSISLPQSWEVRTIESLGVVVTGTTPSTSHPEYYGGDVPFVTPADLDNRRFVSRTERCLTQEGADEARLLPPNSVLVTCIGNLGKVGQASIPLATNQQINSFIPYSEIDSDFAYWVMHTLQRRLEIEAGLQVVPIVNKTTFSSLPVPFPPLPEQRRIAEVLDAADEAIRQTERVIAKLREVKKGLLHDLLTRGLDADGNLRDPEAHPEQFKDSPLGRIPKEWEAERLKNLVSFGSGYGFPRDLQGNRDDEIPFFKVSDMSNPGNERYLREAKHYVSYELAGRQGWTAFPPESVAFAKVGAALLLNRRRLLVKPSLVDNNMMVAIPGEAINPTYLYLWLQTVDFGIFVQPGVVPSVNQGQVGSLLISLPSVKEQLRIVRFLDAHDARIRAEEATLDKLHQVKRGLMDDLLTGRVRVG